MTLAKLKIHLLHDFAEMINESLETLQQKSQVNF